MTNKNIIYRVYDHKNNYTQSYSSINAEAFKWACDCATRVNGRVDQVDTSEDPIHPETIFKFELKK